jgi:hypothetical protein
MSTLNILDNNGKTNKGSSSSIKLRLIPDIVVVWQMIFSFLKRRRRAKRGFQLRKLCLGDIYDICLVFIQPYGALKKPAGRGSATPFFVKVQ